MYLSPNQASFKHFVHVAGSLPPPILRRWTFYAQCTYMPMRHSGAIKIEDTNFFAFYVALEKYFVLPLERIQPNTKIRPSCLSKETTTRRRRLNLSTSDRFSANRGHPPVELKKTRLEIAQRSSFKESYMNNTSAL